MSNHEDGVLEIFHDALDIEVPGLDVDVIETGLLDSLGLVVLVSELEERFGIRIPFESLDVDDFRTARSIASLVEGQREAAP